MRKCLIWNPLTPPVASAFEAFGHSFRTTHRPHRGEVHRPRRWESAGIHTWRRETSRDTKAAQDEATPIGYLLISRPPIRISAPRLNLPTFGGHPRRGGTSRSDAGNSSSGKSRDPDLASGGEGLFPGHLGNVPKFQDLSPMYPNTCVTSVVGMDRAWPRHWKSEVLSVPLRRGRQHHNNSTLLRRPTSSKSFNVWFVRIWKDGILSDKPLSRNVHPLVEVAG